MIEDFLLDLDLRIWKLPQYQDRPSVESSVFAEGSIGGLVKGQDY